MGGATAPALRTSGPAGRNPLFLRGALPLGLPDTRSREPLRRLAPFAWLAHCVRSRTVFLQRCSRRGPVRNLQPILHHMLHARVAFGTAALLLCLDTLAATS